MARYTDDSIDRVKDAIDMVDLVSAKTELRRAGGARMEGLCPFHDERTPSFGIDPVQKLYHCFGCGAGGDAITFVRETEGVDFIGAIELLADRYGIELQVADEDPAEAERRRRRSRLYELLERTAAFYVRYLWESAEAAPAREYLAGRGLEESMLRRFRVGYAPSAWDKVLVASRRAGFSNKEIYDAGLAKRGREGRIYDHFRRRITFPLADTRGRVVGFGARAMGDDQKPKYVNTPEGELFHKRRMVYAADLARAAAAKAGSVVVTEGYTDVIALHQAGLENAVCIMGTSLTEEQVRALRRLAPVAQLALDADNAGQEAMLRAAKVAAGEDLKLRVVALPAGLDPADLAVREGPDEIRRLLDASTPFARFRVLRILATGDTGSAEGKEAVLDEMRDTFAELPEIADGRLMRDELVQIISDRMDLRAEVVMQHLRRPPGARRSAAPPARAARPAPPPARPERRDRDRDPGDFGDPGPEWSPFDRPAAPQAAASDLARIVAQTEEVERRFLAFCLALPDLGASELAKIDPDEHFTSPLARRAASHLREHLTAPTEHLPEDDPELRALVTELSVRAVRDPASPATLAAQRLQLELRRLDNRMKEARSSGQGGVTELARARDAVKAKLDDAMEQASANS
jgi:DNA primase